MLGNLFLYPGGQKDAASLALLCKSLADARLKGTMFLRVWAHVCAPHSCHRFNVGEAGPAVMVETLKCGPRRTVPKLRSREYSAAAKILNLHRDLRSFEYSGLM